jgi:membrane-associated phospholipid phosphatase
MVALQFHYMSDVVVGILLGLAISGSVAFFLDAVAARWQRTKDLVPPDDSIAESDGAVHS